MSSANARDAALAAVPSQRLSALPRARAIAVLAGLALCNGLALSLTGCGKPRSADAASEAPPPPPARDEAWSAAARAAYFAGIAGSRYGTPSPGDAAVQGWPIQWPFAGFAPEPAWFATRPLRAPIASVEWRFAEGALVETFVDGDPALLRLALDARPSTSFANTPANATGTSAAQPPRSWSWPVGFDAPWSADHTLHASNTRWLWCDAFADIFEIAPGGPYLLAVDLPGGELETSVFWPDASGNPDPKATIEWPQDARSHRTERGGLPVVASADFDENGSVDFLHLSGRPRGGSLGIAYEGVLVLTDAKRRRASVVPIATNGIGFIDLDGNGRSEMMLAREGVQVAKCEDGFPHDFTVTDLLGFQSMKVVDLAGVDRVRKGGFTGTFPAWRALDGDPAQAFRPLLSGNLKRELHASGFPPYRRR